MTLFKSLLGAAVASTVVSASPLQAKNLYARDLISGIPAQATDDQDRWAPALDFDTDSCYNAAAISPDGQINQGDHPGKSDEELLGQCRNEDRLRNTNVYVRTKCNNGWCAHIYDYYFEVDKPGHRHDWEHIAVWVKDGQLKFAATSAHGDWDIRLTDEGVAPPMLDSHVKAVYHKDGPSTHAFRWAKDGDGDEPPENHFGSWRYGRPVGLIDWDAISPELRQAVSDHDFGSAAMAIKDGAFNGYLDSSRWYCPTELECPGNLAPEFDPNA
ncbi:hypothetical protein HJFPF1_00014 [Paramyrothecium foliicola]|nr:hypothetical protein HJFPF1_00014 [Paramyrothecium foliicola]